MHCRVQRLALTATVCIPAAVYASRPSTRPGQLFTLVGVVVDSSGAAVPQAEVDLLDSRRVVLRLRSDTSSHFRARDLRSRSFHLSVRRLGFEPRDVAMDVPADQERTDVRIVLDHAAAQLTATEVVAARNADVRLHSFYDRLANNKYGDYIEPETIERRQPIFTSELLRAVPGVKVQPSEGGGNRVTIRGCAPVVWVDGARMQDAQVDDVVDPQNVAAIEVYRSFSGLPSEYFDRSANCGTIIIWTKLR